MTEVAARVGKATVATRKVRCLRLSLLAFVFAQPCLAQTTAAPGIDVELYSPVDGTNRLCIEPGATAWVHVHARPGIGSFSCD